MTGVSTVHVTSSRSWIAALTEHRARCKEAVHGSSTSGGQNSLGLLANSQGTRGKGDSEEDWVSLMNPHISQEERDKLLSHDSQSEVDEAR